MTRTVVFNLDRPRVMKLGHKTLKGFCASTGTLLPDIQGVISDYNKLTILLWWALRGDDPSLTPEQLDDLLEEVPFNEIIAKSVELISATFGNDEEDAEANPPA